MTYSIICDSISKTVALQSKNNVYFIQWKWLGNKLSAMQVLASAPFLLAFIGQKMHDFTKKKIIIKVKLI